MASNSPLECGVCQEEYDSDERCPRTFFCSHSLCSDCINQLIRGNSKKCPFCRWKFDATEASEIMINHTALDLLTYIAQTSNLGTAADHRPTSLKMRISCLKSETKQNSTLLLVDCKETENLIRDTMQEIANIETSVIRENGKIEREVFPNLRNMIAKNTKIVNELRGLYKALHFQLKEIQTKEKEIEQITEKLESSSPSTFKETGTLIDEIEEKNHSIDNWFKNFKETVSEEQEAFQEADEKIEIAKMKVEIILEILSSGQTEERVEEEEDNGDCQSVDGEDQEVEEYSEVEEDEENAEGEDGEEGEEEENDNDEGDNGDETRTTQCAASAAVLATKRKKLPRQIKVRMLRELGYPLRYLLEHGRIFACQHQEDGTTRFARISVSQEDRLCLHHLWTGSLPNNVRVVDYKEAMSFVDVTSRLVFLDVAAGRSKLGRLYIRLAPDTPFAQNFAYLCTGEMGPSYANTNFLKVGHRCHSCWEWIRGGDYEANDGTKGAGVVPGLRAEARSSQYKCPCLAGTVTSGWDMDDGRSAQFVIRTRHNSDTDCQPSFGMVEEGLGILIDAIARYENIRDVSIQDCGIMLPI